MKKLHFLTLLALLISVFACKDNSEEVDTNAPVLTIESPTENAMIQGAVQIKLHVTDESLHEMDVKVIQDSDGAIVLEEAPMVHDETDYHYEKTFTLSGLTMDDPLTLTVTVEDHSANITTQTVKFTVKP